jgi:hypothetical protein
MRINRRSLLRVIRNTVLERTHTNPNLVSIYLGGSVLGSDYALGGTVDIDLFFIHAGPVEQEREIVRLTDEVHLDIAHHDQKAYRHPKELRLHPWMGHTIKDGEIFYDPSHFMDFTQASVRGQFARPDNVLIRVRKQAEAARDIWFGYEMSQPEAGPMEVADYLRALWNASNAIACLTGSPLTERRYLLQYPLRAEIKDWQTSWESAYDALPPGQAPARLHPDRKYYYLRAFEEMLGSDQPGTVLWPLLNTWTTMANILSENSAAQDNWQQVFEQVGLLGDGFGERIEAL